MRPSLHKSRVEAIDKRAVELITLLQEVPELPDVNHKQTNYGSLGDSKPIIFDKPISPTIGQVDFRGNQKSIFKKIGDKLVGITIENYGSIENLIALILKDKEVSMFVSVRFLQEFIHEWMFDRFERKKDGSNFCEILLDAIDDSIHEYEVSHPLLHVIIDEPFLVHDVTIGFHKEKVLDNLIQEFGKNNPVKTNPFIPFKTFALGQVFCSSRYTAEFHKAEELALRRHTLVVQLFKITSDTIDYPDIKISFDIDNLVKINSNNKFFAFPVGHLENLKIQYYNIATNATIDLEDIEKRKQRGLEIFVKLLKRDLQQTELIKSILFSVSKFANAISESDYHFRIVDIFTAVESLVLRDENDNILSSLRKYVPKIVSKDPVQRKEIDRIINNMYGIRSAMVHRGSRSKIELSELGKLQRITLCLLSEFVKYSTTHKERSTILSVIDDALNRAG